MSGELAVRLIRTIDELATIEAQMTDEDELAAMQAEEWSKQVHDFETACSDISARLADVIRDLLIAAKQLKDLERR